MNDWTKNGDETLKITNAKIEKGKILLHTFTKAIFNWDQLHSEKKHKTNESF